MDKEYLSKLLELNYANLNEAEEKRLRELEKSFNNEFNKQCYFMAMKRE